MVTGKGAKGLLIGKSSTLASASATAINNGNKSNTNDKAGKKKPISGSSRAGLQVSTCFQCSVIADGLFRVAEKGNTGAGDRVEYVLKGSSVDEGRSVFERAESGVVTGFTRLLPLPSKGGIYM